MTTREIGIFLPSVLIRSPGGIAVALLAATDERGESSDDDEVTLVALHYRARPTWQSIATGEWP